MHLAALGSWLVRFEWVQSAAPSAIAAQPLWVLGTFALLPTSHQCHRLGLLLIFNTPPPRLPPFPPPSPPLQINAIVYFSSSVFRQAGVASGNLASAFVGLTNVLGSVVATGLMDKAGRK